MRLLQKSEENRKNYEAEGHEMIPLDGLRLEDKGTDDSEYRKRYGFLDDLQLHQVERAAVGVGSHAVRRDHEEILQQCYSPRKEYDDDERPVLGAGNDLRKFQLSVPRERHEDIRYDQQDDGPESLHN